MDFNTKKNIWLVAETVIVFVVLSYLSIQVSYIENYYFSFFAYVPLLLFQGLWFYRLYIVGHEASHKKLFRKSLLANEIMGSIILLPLMVPINVYRKIHLFHHGFNRKDNHTSTLDTFTTKKITPLKKIYFYTVWYLSVFCGGFFIHSFISVILFLFIPPKLAQKISPAFKGWDWTKQFRAILLFSLGVLFHLFVFILFGSKIYLLVLGYPMLAFAWVLSLLVYIFHYNTTVGTGVRFNVRSVKPVPFFSWVLMNFNEHATHHQHPNISWYDLPKQRKALPIAYEEVNQNTWYFFRAIINQLKGPRIIEEDA